MNSKLKRGGIISEELISRGILDFEQICEWVKNLPYQRNIHKSNIFCILKENCGTCSTKHAFLKRLADENKIEVQLMLGVFLMNDQNAPKIANVLQKYHLKEMPEAHNYLKFKNKIQDFTSRNSRPEDFVNDLVEEIEIQPDQITDFKVEYHKNFLKNYLQKDPQINYSLKEFWQIREECIAALQQ